MTLTAKEIAEITRLLEDSSFDELRLEIDGLKLHLKRRSAAAGEPAQIAAADVVPALAAAVDPVSPSAVKPAANDRELQDVSAPMLGTFYRAPKPGEPPYVEVGSRVEDDTIVGIIEVMKLMNTVRAGVRGTVVEILCRDGTLVEYGEALLRVRRVSET